MLISLSETAFDDQVYTENALLFPGIEDSENMSGFFAMTFY